MPLYSRPLRLKNTVKEGERKEGEGGPLKVARADPQVAVDILLSLGALTCSRGAFLRVGLAGDGKSGMTSSLLSLLLVTVWRRGYLSALPGSGSQIIAEQIPTLRISILLIEG